MPLELKMQINLVICSLIGGLITGTLFDLYRGLRGINSIRIITIIEDILFCILIALIVFIFLLYTNYALFTPYVYTFIIISSLLYFKFLSRFFYFFELMVVKTFYKLIRIILKNVCYPFKIIQYKITHKTK